MVKTRYCSLNEFIFKKVKGKYSLQLDLFSTYQKDLKDFLVEDALKMQELCLGSTYLVFDKEQYSQECHSLERLQLLGYVTLLNDSIRLDTSLRAVFGKQGIIYRFLPAVKIGRLCVDERFERRGIGKLILTFCIRKACFLNEQTACRFITVDAKRSADPKKDVLLFYTSLGFAILVPESTRGKTVRKTRTIPLYLDLLPFFQEKKAKFIKEEHIVP